MMDENQNKCPNCQSEYCYQEGFMWICPECAHEWSSQGNADSMTENESKVLDANGNELQSGDTITVIKSLKVKGSTNSVKVGTKVKNIRIDPFADDGHNISCKIDGFGTMGLKSEFVKKV